MDELDYYDERAEMLSYVPSDAKRVLDVGCGTGLFGSALRKRGCYVAGIEPWAEPARAARQRLDEVYVDTVENVFSTLPEAHYDCMVFNDVLEHLVDPWKILQVAKERLTLGGSVVASIPNVRHYRVVKELLVSGAWSYQDYGVLDRTHLRFFTKTSMLELFESAGFTVQRQEGIRPARIPRKFGVFVKLISKRPEELTFERYALVGRPRT